MASTTYGTSIAIGAAALMLAATDTFGGSGTAHGGGIWTHSNHHSSFARPFRHHKNIGAFWPGAGGYYEPPAGEPPVDVTPSASSDVHYTYTYDVPWDAVHRFPQAVTPSEPYVRPYVPACPS